MGFPGGSHSKKNPPAVQETQVWSLGEEDPLEKEMATHSSILAWEIPGTEEPGGLLSMGSQKSQMRLSTAPHTISNHLLRTKLIESIICNLKAELCVSSREQTGYKSSGPVSSLCKGK